MGEATNPYAPPAAELSEPGAATAPYFAVPTAKLLALSVATFGIYPTWWSYKNWRAIRDLTGEALWPIPRAFFGGIMNFVLFPRLQHAASQLGLHTRLAHELCAFASLALGVALRVTPDESPFELLLIPLLGVPFVPSNALARRMNLALAPRAKPTAPWNAADLTILLLGLLLFAAAVVGTFVPELAE